MLDIELDMKRGVAILTPRGKLHASDFEAAADVVDPYISTHGRLKGVMILAEHFPGWENIPAFVAHMQFIRDRQEKIGRVALVSDSPLLKVLPEIASHFVTPEIRQFPGSARDEALVWLTA